MKLFSSALLLSIFATGCVLQDKKPIATQVVTFPEGAVVEFNGRQLGRAPAEVVLPQDTNGKLVERAVLRAIPNTAQRTLVAQTRVLEPGTRTDRVPNRIMIDLTLVDTNAPAVAQAPVAEAQKGLKTPAKRPRASDRSKPTQPVGMDRWEPGIY